MKSGKPLDPLDGKKVDPRLKELRRKYLEAEKALSDERAEKETELRIVGIRALTELSRNTTKSGDIDAVRAIENQIVEWRSKLPSSNDQKRIASIIPDGEGTLKRFREDQILWTDKAVEILEIPDELDGLSFNYTGKELNSVRVRESGTVYALTAAPGASNDRSRELISAGFKRASIDSFQLYGAHPADFVAIYEKDVKADEILTFRKFAIILGQR